MLRRSLSALVLIAFYSAGAAFLGEATPARAQDAATVISRVAELTQRKGVYQLWENAQLFNMLGWSTPGGYYKYMANYQGKDGIWHTFTVTPAQQGQPTRILLFVNDIRSGYEFLVGMDGRLNSAIIAQSAQKDWTHRLIASDDAVVRQKYAAELAYWNVRQNDLANSPDR